MRGLRGRVMTDSLGRYRFDTIRPASYPQRAVPAHVHLHVIEVGCCTYYIDSIHFSDDPLLGGREPEDSRGRRDRSRVVGGQIPRLFPLLPLHEGYVAAVEHFNPWRRGGAWSTIRVVGSSSADAGTGPVDCWVVDGGELFPGHRVTYWIAKRTRHVVRTVTRGDGDGPAYWSMVR